MRDGRRIACLGLVLYCALLGPWCRPARAGACGGDAWVFYGAVRDVSGNPVAQAEVWLLLDQVSEKKFLREGMRGQRFSTNDYGKYQAGLVCGDDFDRPNPCASKPKHLTVLASVGATMKAHVFKLKSLEVVEERGVCFVQVPEIRLKTGP